MQFGEGAQWSQLLTDEVYRNLLKVAGALVKFESPLLRDQAEDVLNQTLLRFMSTQRRMIFIDQKHFCSVMTVAMRRCLIDMIRSSRAQKRRSDMREDFTEHERASSDDSVVDQIVVRELLAALHRNKQKRSALVLEMHALKQASLKEIASELSLSVRTVRRDLAVVRKWLASELEARVHAA